MTGPALLTLGELELLLAEVLGAAAGREAARQWLPVLAGAAIAGAEWIASQLGLTPHLAANDPAVRQLLTRRRPVIAQITQTTQARVRRVLAAGIATDASAAELVASLRELMVRMRRVRAPMIALMEVGGAWEVGAQREMVLQIIPARLWITQRDRRVRPSHVTLDGQCRLVDDPFRTVAGELIRYPRDPEAADDESLGCRCFTAPLARGCATATRALAGEVQRGAYWKAVNAAMGVVERQMIRAVRATFTAQEAALLTGVRRR